MKEKGELLAVEGLTVPPPFSVMLTLVALPPNWLLLRVKGPVPQVLPEEPDRLTVGPFTQSQDISKLLPVRVHPDEFRTVMV